MKKIYALKIEAFDFEEVYDKLLDCIQDAIIWGNDKLMGINSNIVNDLLKLMHKYVDSYNNKENIKYNKNIIKFFKCKNEDQIKEIQEAINLYYNGYKLIDKVLFVVKMLNGTTSKKWNFKHINFRYVAGVMDYIEWNYLIYPVEYDKSLINRIQDLYFGNVVIYQIKLIDDTNKTIDEIVKSIEEDGFYYPIGQSEFTTTHELKKIIVSCFSEPYEVERIRIKNVQNTKNTYETY